LKTATPQPIPDNARAAGTAGRRATPAWGVIFDWDGVIVDSSDAHRESWERLAREENRPLPPGHFEKGFGLKNPLIIRDILGWTADPQEIDRLSHRKEEIFRTIVREKGVRLIPGAAELLAALRASSVPAALASSTDRENIELILRRHLPQAHFTAIVAAEDVSRGKPEPDVFLAAARAIGLPPERCVAVEDAPAGIQAARRGGMRVLALATTRPVSSLQGADLVRADLREVRPSLLYGLLEHAE